MTPPREPQGRVRRLLADLRAARRPAPREIAALACAAAAGAAFHRLGVPLAWVLGPLIATAALSIAGWPVFTPVAGRRFGQVTIGASIGLNISAAFLRR